MKPATFDYHAPESVDETLALLADHGDAAKLLAGGQSLIPAMNFRLAQPAVLIDLGRTAGLDGIRAGVADDVSDGLTIGAMTRQRDVERSAAVAARAPLVHRTMPWIAHPQIRNRGTFGGSIAHADPSAELPAVAVAVGAECRLRSVRGERTVAADDFFTGLFETALEPDELLVEIALPPLPPGTGCAFQEIARRHGDYALAGVAVTLRLDDEHRVEDARIVFLSVGEGPVVARAAAELLRGQSATDELFREAAHTAAADDIDPPADIHASKPYRRRLAEVLTRRTLAEAMAAV